MEDKKQPKRPDTLQMARDISRGDTVAYIPGEDGKSFSQKKPTLWQKIKSLLGMAR